jgi:hypothetical protein
MKIISLFPKLIDEQMNEELDAEISEEELKVVLNSFQKEKSLGMGRWTIEFF